MRSVVTFVAFAALFGLAGCGGTEPTGPTMTERPVLKATCILPAGGDDNRAYDSGYGVVAVSDRQKVEVTGSNQEEIRARLHKLGVATKEHPCQSLSVQRLEGGTGQPDAGGDQPNQGE